MFEWLIRNGIKPHHILQAIALLMLLVFLVYQTVVTFRAFGE